MYIQIHVDTQRFGSYEIAVSEEAPTIIGKALIFSFETYSIPTDGPRVVLDRDHNVQDRTGLELLLKLIGFEVIVCVDWTATEVRETVRKVCQMEHGGVFLCCVMSHGFDRAGVSHIITQDNLELSTHHDIILPFSRAKSLLNCVKVYMINACREDSKRPTTHSPLLTELRPDLGDLISNLSNTLIVHSSLPSTSSFKTDTQGSLFLDKLFTAICKSRGADFMSLVDTASAELTSDMRNQDYCVAQYSSVTKHGLAFSLSLTPNVSY